MARTFNGTSSDIIKCAIGAAGVNAPATWAAVAKKAADAVTGVLVRQCGTGTLTYGGLQYNTTNNLRYFGASGTASSAFTVLQSEGWLVAAGSKATGSATPRFHKQVVSTGVWTHSDGDIAVTDTAVTSGTIWLGANNAPFQFQGDLAAAACWNYVLSDVQVEQLGISFLHWLRLAPSGMWLLDQASTATAVTDLTGGGADQTSVAGTAVVTQPNPPLPVFRPLGALGAG